MQVRFRCGSCGTSVQIDSSHAGKRAKCPKCGTVLQIPTMDAILSAQAKQSGTASPPPLPEPAAAAQHASQDSIGLSDFRPRFEADDFAVEPPAPPTTTPPFAPPPTFYRPPEAAAPVQFAGFWKRFAAYFIDQIVLLIGMFVVAFVAAIVVAIRGGDPERMGGVFELGSWIVSWLYFALMESSYNQATLGKLALGIKVTDLNGQPIGFGRATGRYFGKILSGLALFIGFIMIGFTPKKQGLHDMIAGTLVVDR